MDEEEQRRNASAAAFGQAASAGYENPQQAVADIRARGAENAPTNEAAWSARATDNLAQRRLAAGEKPLATGNVEQTTTIDESASVPWLAPVTRTWDPADAAAMRQNAVPGASEAFGQLDAAMPADPTQFDERMAEGTQEGVADVLRQSFDENLKAARDAVAGQARRDRFGGEQRRAGDKSSEISQYRDRLLQMANQTLSGGGVEQNQPQDPYAAQREREALVAKRLGTFDLFSDAKTTRTPISAETIQTNAYDKVLMGKDNKDLFDSFL